MADTTSMPTSDPSKVLREMRDAGMESWARLALMVTSSDTYSQLSSMIAKPSLVAAGLARKATDAAMAQLLARANLPSRADVLALSVRLTHIEMAIDDLGAAMEAMRASASQPSPSGKRAPANDRPPRRSTAPSEG